MDKAQRLGKESILKLIIIFSLPSIVGMIINSIYNIVDRVFVSKYVGEIAFGGLTVAFPLMMFIFAFAGLLGVGASALISIKLGENKKEEASNIFGNLITLSFVVNTCVSILIYIFLEPLLHLLHTSDEVMPYALDYMRIILLGNVFNTVAFSLANVIRTEGKPIIAMATTIISAITNIVLDYVFIAKLGWGVPGSAWATIIAQLVSFTLLGSYYVLGKSYLKISKEYFIIKLNYVKEICEIGSSAFIGNISTSLYSIFFTIALNNYSDMYITSLGAINSLNTIAIMPLLGLQQGIQPIFGYNFGAQKIDRVKKTLFTSIKISLVFGTLPFLAFELIPKTLLTIFIDSTSQTMPIAIEGIRLYSLSLPILGIIFVTMSFFQATKNSGKALIVNLAKQFFFLIPLIIILPKFFDANGVWLAGIGTDYLVIALTLVMLIPTFKSLERKAKENFENKNTIVTTTNIEEKIIENKDVNSISRSKTTLNITSILDSTLSSKKENDNADSNLLKN